MERFVKIFLCRKLQHGILGWAPEGLPNGICILPAYFDQLWDTGTYITTVPPYAIIFYKITRHSLQSCSHHNKYLFQKFRCLSVTKVLILSAISFLFIFRINLAWDNVFEFLKKNVWAQNGPFRAKKGI